MNNTVASFPQTPKVNGLIFALTTFANAHIIGGVILGLLWWFPSLHAPLTQAIYGDKVVADPTQIAFWICILGPTIASWGVLCRIALTAFVHQPHQTTFRLLMASILIWAPFDAIMCMSNQIYFAGMIDFLVVIVFCGLTYALWQQRIDVPRQMTMDNH